MNRKESRSTPSPGSPRSPLRLFLRFDMQLAALLLILATLGHSFACAQRTTPGGNVSPEAVATASLDSPEPRPEETFVETYLAAFNSHSADRLAALVTEDLEVIYVDQSGASAVGTSGREALRTEMEAYFEQFPNVRSRVANTVAVSGRFLSYSEQVTWTRNGAEHSQSSLTVLERDGTAQGGSKIRRVWYYPEQK